MEIDHFADIGRKLIYKFIHNL